MTNFHDRTSLQPAVFLDRDGVIIHNRANYVKSWQDVHIYPFTCESLKVLNQFGFLIFMITNQSPIGRGILLEDTFLQINQKILKIFETEGVKITHVYYCPHAPNMNCTCRKPQPGMILRAVEEYSVDVQQSWLVGDALSDIQAGINAGIKNNILVQTGRGKKQLKKISDHLNFWVEPNLKSAVTTIIKNSKHKKLPKI